MVKYIDTKLRKDDKLARIKRLEQAQKGVDTSLLMSTKKLGQRTERANLKRASDWAESEDEDEEDETPAQAASMRASTKIMGAGLKAPLELGEGGNPVIKNRRRKRRKVDIKFDLKPTVAEEWGGLSDDTQSEASSNAESGEDDEHEHVSHSSDSELGPDSGSEPEPGAEDEEDDDDSGSSSDGKVSNLEEDDSQSDTAKAQKKTRAFKLWAEQARNDAIGFTPSTVMLHVSEEFKKSFVPRPLAMDQEPLPEGFIATSTVDRKVHAVEILRSEDIQTARLQLPILAEEQKVFNSYHSLSITI